MTMMDKPSARPSAYTARIFTPAVMKALDSRFSLRANSADTVLSPREIGERAKGCAYLFVSVTEQIGAEVIASLLPELRVIATLSVGTDHIDLEAARAAGIAVVMTPDVLSVACAELAWMLILGAARRGQEAGALIRSNQWRGWAPTQLLGRGLAGRRLGILGMGRIGREVAKRATGFDVAVHYHNRRPLDASLQHGAIYHDDPESLLAHSDILCLCAPGGGALTGFLDTRRIALMPKGAIVINLARGELIDDNALIAALTSGHLFAVGLDVYNGEPAIDPRYRTLPNAFLSAHLGSATEETRNAMGFALLNGIDAFESGDAAPNLIHTCEIAQ
jgi:glyoxylate reductase